MASDSPDTLLREYLSQVRVDVEHSLEPAALLDSPDSDRGLEMPRDVEWIREADVC
jgi:hypothetical protein